MAQTTIKVKRSEVSDEMAITMRTNLAGNFFLANLQAFFPGACGLSDQYGTLAMEKKGENLLIEAPMGGWDPNYPYVVRFPDGHKRGRGVLGSSPTHTGYPPQKIFKEDKQEEGKYSPFLFQEMCRSKATGRCFLAVDPYYAISYLHGSHQQLEAAHKVTIKSMEKDHHVTVEVVEKFPEYDLLLTKSNEPLISFQPTLGFPYPGQEAIFVGIDDNMLAFNRGIVYSNRRISGNFCQGTYSTKAGHSGGGLFSKNMEILGMHVQKEDLQSDGKRLDMTAAMANYLGRSLFLDASAIRTLITERKGKDFPELVMRDDEPRQVVVE